MSQLPWYLRAALWLYSRPAATLLHLHYLLEDLSAKVENASFRIMSVNAHQLRFSDRALVLTWNKDGDDPYDPEVDAPVLRGAARAVAGAMGALVLLCGLTLVTPWAWQQAGQFAQMARACLSGVMK